MQTPFFFSCPFMHLHKKAVLKIISLHMDVPPGILYDLFVNKYNDDGVKNPF